MLEKLKSFLRKDNSVVLIGNLSASAFGVVTFMLLARTLDKSDFGEWALFISAAGLLDLMKTGLIRQALVRAISIESDPTKQKAIMASATAITIFASLGLAVVVGIANIFVGDIALKSFFVYFPIYTLVSASNNLDTWQSHAFGLFKRMNSVRLWTNIFFLGMVASGLIFQFSLDEYFIGYIISQLLVSGYSFFTTLRKIELRKATREGINELLKFGKHSIATLTGSNLLKSADSLLIGWFLGTEAVAIYAIPLKVLDLIEIPLRGFVMTAFRKLAKMHSDGLVEDFLKLLFNNLKFLSAAILPAALIMLIFPGFFVKILGGAGFEDSYLLLQIFLIPLIMLPLDKFIGISLDAVNLPKINAIKVWIMALVNIIGDIAAIYYIGTLWSVAAVTIITSTAGILFGVFSHPYLYKRQKTNRSLSAQS